MLVAQVDDTVFAIPAQTAREVHAVTEIEEVHATNLRLARGEVMVGGVLMPVVSLQTAYAAVARREGRA